MTRICQHSSVVAIIALAVTALAQESGSPVADDRASLVRTTRLLRKFDADGNGTFERSENAAAWRRYRRLDANRDGSLSVDELRRERIPVLETGGERRLDVVYKTIGGRDLRLDLYYPARGDEQTAAPHPVVVYTHGGGWAAGSKQGVARGSFKTVFEKLLDHGFAVASVDYRLARQHSGVTMRDCVIDAKDAVRYLAKNSERLALDPERFLVMGDSAGGQIAQMLLLSSPKSLPGDERLSGGSYEVLGGVSWYGPCDFEKIELFNHDDRADFRDRFGPRILGPNPDPATKLERYREMSPVNYLGKDSPPLLMIQGDEDTTIPVEHAYHMKQKADAVNAPVEVVIVRNAGHNWRKVDADIDPPRDAIVGRTVKFLVDASAPAVGQESR